MMNTPARPSQHAAAAVHAVSPFEERYHQSLRNHRQQANLLSFQRAWARDRGAAVAELDFHELRGELAAAKQRMIDDLDNWVASFAAAAEANGAHIHHAADAAAAREQVLALCRQYGTDLVIKSKSMVSEEVELNSFLQAHGVQPVEGDLGEWLVQLAGERPSHMVLPVIHKNRQQAAALVSAATGAQLDGSDVAAVVHTARDAIRASFPRAGIGLTGANALVVEDGSVVLVTNEGNADLTVTLPPVHVVLAGVDKLVPTLADAAVQLRLLARSATAQRITVYTSFVRRPAEGHHLHIILVDNGRMAMRADPRYRDALRCIRCGACADVCPPFQVVGGHVFGHIYTGAIGLVVTPAHHGLAADAGPQSLCISCNACQTVCPVDIPLPRQILDRRAEVTRQAGPAGVTPKLLRAALRLWVRPRLFDQAIRLAAAAVLPLSRGEQWLDMPAPMRRLPFISRQADWRSLPVPVRRPYRDRVTSQPSARSAPRLPSQVGGKTVALFAQCLTDRFWPEQAEAVQRVLEALGCRVVFPRGQHCCGLPALDAGEADAARAMARQTIAALEAVEANFVVSGAASCVAAIVHDYAHLLRDEPTWAERAAHLRERTVTFTHFLAEIAGVTTGALDDRRQQPVVYHDFCQAGNVLGQTAEPRWILQELLGCRLTELPESVCCGFGGSRSAIYPEVAAAIVQRKLDAIASTGVTTVATDNPGCIAHLRAILRHRRSPVRVLHVAELVAARLA